MSIRIMSWVWDTSPSGGTELLIELAFADYSDDSGRSWPSKKAIAKKARCTERYVQEVAHKLSSMIPPRLRIYAGQGPKGTNVYAFARGEVSSPLEPQFSENSKAQGGEPQFAKGENPGTPDPSGDPSTDPLSVSDKAKPRLIVKDFKPTEEQLANYREKFPAADLTLELTRFNDYQAARAHGYADHNRAFLNWLRSPYRDTAPTPINNARRSPRAAATTGRDLGAEALAIIGR